MKKIDELRYVAEDGYVFVEKETGKRFGSHIYLGAASIDSFKEDKMTKGELEANYAQIVGKNSQGVFTVKNPLD